MVRRNAFRSDLYYRLKRLPDSTTALAGTPRRYSALVEHFVEILARRMGKQIELIPPEVMSALLHILGREYTRVAEFH